MQRDPGFHLANEKALKRRIVALLRRPCSKRSLQGPGVVGRDAELTGNDWKRSRAMLAATIQNGVRRKSDNVDVMPAWKGRLSERDVEDVLNWMQSLWPAEVYDAWTKTQATAATPKS